MIHAINNVLSYLNSSNLRLGTRITNALNGCFLFNLFDDAIADLLCLHTYTHGTSPKCYSNIMKVGVDPNHGGKGGESSFFEVFEINRAKAVESEGEKSGWNCKNRFFAFHYTCPEFIKRWQPRVYSIVSCIGENCQAKQSKWKKYPMMGISLLQGFCSPVLKFRFQPNDPNYHFEWDKTFSESRIIAAYTEQPISADHIGLYGSFHEGINQQWKERMKKHPFLLMRGVAKLATTVALVALAIAGAARYPSVKKALLIYSVVKGLQISGRFFVPLSYER